MSIFIITLMIAGSYGVLGQNINLLEKQEQNLFCLKANSNRGYIISNGEEYNVNVEISGELRVSDDANLDISISSSESFEGSSFSVSGKMEKKFTGFDLSNVDMDNPETLEISLGERTVVRYVNAENEYSLFGRFNKIVDDEDVGKKTFEKIKFLSYIEKIRYNFPLLSSFIDLFQKRKGSTLQGTSEPVIQNPDITVMIKKDGTGFLYGQYVNNGEVIKVVSDLSSTHSSIQSFSEHVPSEKINTLDVTLNVPYRNQMEVFIELNRLPWFFAADKAACACAVASVAMMEDFYTGGKVPLSNILAYKDVGGGNGWSQEDIIDYLNHHSDAGNGRSFGICNIGAASWSKSDVKTVYINKAETCIEYNVPVVTSIHYDSIYHGKHIFHSIVLFGYSSDALLYHDPMYPVNVNLWYNNVPFGKIFFDKNTIKDNVIYDWHYSNGDGYRANFIYENP